MTPRGLVVWLAGHPMAVVVASLALLGVVGMSLASLLRTPDSSTPMGASAMVARSVLPSPSSSPPVERVEQAHRALHALGRACETSGAKRRPGVLPHTVRVIERFAVDYPNGGFAMDDESGTTLALLVVVRFELQGCEPSLARRIEALIPDQYRGE